MVVYSIKPKYVASNITDINQVLTGGLYLIYAVHRSRRDTIARGTPIMSVGDNLYKYAHANIIGRTNCIKTW